MAAIHHVSADNLEVFITKLYEEAGMDREEAKYHAYGLVKASLRGVDSHGVMRTRAYLDRIRNGAINVSPNIRPVGGVRAMLELDADRASGFTAGHAGMTKAVELAREYSVGLVLVKNSNHFGAAALYAQIAVDAGMVGIATTNVKPLMAAPGAAGQVTGNNPFAIGIPTYNNFPFMLDMALSVVAGGKLKDAIARNVKIPLDWAVDRNGNPTDDPQKGFDGYLLPAGGFKGLGIAHAIDILCGVMSGGAFQDHIKSMYKNPLDSSETCHLFLALNICGLIDKEAISQRMAEYRSYLQSIPTVSGKPLVLPGEPESACCENRRREGIPLPEKVYQDLKSLAEHYQIPCPF